MQHLAHAINSKFGVNVMSLLDGNRLGYRSVLTSASAIWAPLVWRLRTSDRTRAIVQRTYASLIWAVLVGSLAVPAAAGLGSI